MIIKQPANYAKSAVLLVHSVSEFTHSFSFTTSSKLYELTNVVNSEWGYRGRFQIQPRSTMTEEPNSDPFFHQRMSEVDSVGPFGYTKNDQGVI